MPKITLFIGTDMGFITVTYDNGQWQSSPPLLAGKCVVGLATLADRPSEIYVAVQGYGLFKTVDKGLSWRQTLAANAHTLLIDKQNSQRLWVGTEPAGVHCSVDRGETWADFTSQVMQVPSALDWSYAKPPYQARLSTMRQHPTQADTLQAGIEVGGVIRSTDGGHTWHQSDEGLDEEVLDLAVHPNKPSFWLAGTGQGIYQSHNEGGVWEPISIELPYDFVNAIIISSSGVCLVNLAATPPGNWVENAVSVLYRSEDEGQTWQEIAIEQDQPSYISALGFDPFEPNYAYAGTRNGTLYLSQDQGENWGKIGQLSTQINTILVAQVA